MNSNTTKHRNSIYCTWRHRYVCLTPEEWVRQQVLHLLVDRWHYPSGRIAVEVTIANKRVDAIIYDAKGAPWMLLEFKAEHVILSQQTLDQIAVYNRQLHAPYLLLSNGHKTIVAQVNEDTLEFLDTFPRYEGQ